MDKEIRNKYCEADQYLGSVVTQPIPKSDFLDYMRKGVDRLYKRTKGINKTGHMHVNLLERYLNKFGIHEIIPDEQFFEVMWNRMNKENVLFRIETIGVHRLYSVGLKGNDIFRRLCSKQWFKKESQLHGRLRVTDINKIVPELQKEFGKESSKILSLLQGSIKQYSLQTTRKVPRVTRKIVNEYFYPEGLVQRKVLLEIADNKYERFFRLTSKSQEAIKWYEQHGKAVKAMQVLVEGKEHANNEIIKTVHRVSNQSLTDYTKSEKIRHALGFLDDVGKNGFEQATDEDVTKFEECLVERGVKQVQDYLAHVASFYINIHSQGFIEYNPFSYTSLKMSGGSAKKDFISFENIEKIKDLSTVDFKNKFDVRNRLVALLGYDLSIRIGEILFLKIANVKKDPQGEWCVSLKPEGQKGQNKDEEIMYFFFDETKKLLELYLKKIRRQFYPVTDNLIVSNQGKSLCDHQCRKDFQKLCDKFKIQTYYGKNPSPHVLRHSFATLNIEPLGLSLPLYEMIHRLRHVRIETARKHYIHNNPYLVKMKHEVLRQKTRKKTTTDILDGLPLGELEHWLSDRLGLDSGTIKLVRKHHKNTVSNYQIDKEEDDNKMYLAEEEALSRLAHLNVSALTLRKHSFKKDGLHKNSRKRNLRYGKGFQYKEPFIEDLSKNWIYAEDLKRKLNMGREKFSRTLKRDKWRNIKIGCKLYVHKLDCL